MTNWKEHAFIIWIILCKRRKFFFLVLENQGFTSSVKWIFSEISESKTNVVPAQLALSGAVKYNRGINLWSEHSVF